MLKLQILLMLYFLLKYKKINWINFLFNIPHFILWKCHWEICTKLERQHFHASLREKSPHESLAVAKIINMMDHIDNQEDQHILICSIDSNSSWKRLKPLLDEATVSKVASHNSLLTGTRLLLLFWGWLCNQPIFLY